MGTMFPTQITEKRAAAGSAGVQAGSQGMGKTSQTLRHHHLVILWPQQKATISEDMDRKQKQNPTS